MPNLDAHFRALTKVQPKEDWPDLGALEPRRHRSPHVGQLRRLRTRALPRRPHRVAAAALAFAVAAAGVGFAIWAFSGMSQPRRPRPAATVGNGKIAFVATGYGRSQYEIYTVNPDGSELSKLGDGRDPAWSPDGSRLAFTTNGLRPGIALMNADGSGRTELTNDVAYAQSPSWSSDGTKIAFAAQDGIYVMNADGTDAHRIAGYTGPLACADFEPSWSPDGITIAWAVRCDGGGLGIWTVRPDGSGLSTLVAGPPIPPAPTIDGDAVLSTFDDPSWSPDGTRLVFEGGRLVYGVAPGPVIEAGIYVVSANGSGLTHLAEGAQPAWSPDGSEIAFLRGLDVFVMREDGSQVSRLTSGRSASFGLAWQPVPVEEGVPSPTASVTRCTQATTTGDFDGDGTTDDAEFIEVVSGTVSCERGGVVFALLSSQELVIQFGSGQTLEQPFTDCQGGLCAYVFEAADLDGDGRDELAVDVSSGGATGLVEFYRVNPDGIRPLVIAEPGDPPYVEPGPAILGGGFDSGLQSPIVCRVNDDGTHELVSIHAENVGDSLSGPWRVHTTAMVLRDDRLVVTSTADSESSFPGASGIPNLSETAPLDNECP